MEAAVVERESFSGSDFIRSALIGVSQVFFIDNVATGLIFLIAIFWNSWVLGLAAVIGALVSTAVALLIGVPQADIKAGLYGFNGVLLAIALPFFLGHTTGNPAVLWGFVIVGSGLAVIVECAFLHFLKPYGIPASTGPFVLTGWLLLSAAWAFTGLPRTGAIGGAALAAVAQGGGYSFPTLWIGFFKGLGEVMFLDNVVSGALFLIGICVGSWRGGLMAAMGAAIGVLFPVLLGADESTVRLGLYAFNPVLTCMAVGAVFLGFSWKTVLYAFVAGLATLVVNTYLAAFMGTFGLPTLTAPFVFTMYLFLAAKNVAKNIAN